jgi:hypothetical protein
VASWLPKLFRLGPSYSAADHEERRANTRLIAAAPDLLAALQALCPYCIPGMDWTDDTGKELLATARAAISKATGE